MGDTELAKGSARLDGHDAEQHGYLPNEDRGGVETDSTSKDPEFLLLTQQTGDDIVLAKKMRHVNSAINEIGFSWFHVKLFFLNGFGYAVDSMLVVCQSISQQAVRNEFAGRGVTQLYAVSMSSAIGLLAGAIIWGVTGDVIGRKFAFNTSLFVSSIFVIIAGAMPSYVSFCAMVALYSAGAGGNYAIDATNFLEFLPTRQAYLTTILAVWWGFGYLISGLFGWLYLPKWSCDPTEICTWQNNKGWRLLHFTSGGIVFILAIVRVLLFKMDHSPKWLITQNRDEEAVQVIQNIASRAGRPCSLTVEQLREEGEIVGATDPVFRNMGNQLKVLVGTRKQIWATCCLFALWSLVGLADPLYSVFRPYYLSTRGFTDGPASDYITWRNYTLGTLCGLVGPFLAWPLLDTPYIRRRGTLAIGALLSCIFFFGYTQVKTGTQNLVVSCFISLVNNIFYGALYGSTPELFPTRARVMGYGIAVALNRVMNIMATLIGTYGNVYTAAPLFVAASLYLALAILSLVIPIDPSQQQIG